MKYLIGSLSQLDSRGVAMVELKNDRIQLLWEENSFLNPTWITAGAPGEAYVLHSGGDAPLTGCISRIAYDEHGMCVLESLLCNGISPCHAALTEEGRFLVSANYKTGSVSVVALEAGKLAKILQTFVHEGKSVHPERQDHAYVHQITAIPTLSHCFCAADLGMDCLVVYKQDAESGLAHECYRVHLPAGEGPRHVAFAQDGGAYVVTELGNKVFPVHFGDADGWVGEGVSTLMNAAIPNTAAAIYVHDGELYVSNRGENTVAVYERENLRKVKTIPTVGKNPRDFCLLPEKGDLLVACQGNGLYWLRDREVVDMLPFVGAVRIMPAMP